MWKDKLDTIISSSESRFTLWEGIITNLDLLNIAEIGVLRGEFAEFVLHKCPQIQTYHMIDPWRELYDWDKPANVDDDTFSKFLEETKERTEFASDKRIILRGKTTEVIHEIPDESLDLAYIDGDHTLRGITIDMELLYPKIRYGGGIGGDDFTATPLQHFPDYEPSFVFPYAVYFAEATSNPIYGLPYNQFLMMKHTENQYQFCDIVGKYVSTDMKSQLSPRIYAIRYMTSRAPWLLKIRRMMRSIISKK